MDKKDFQREMKRHIGLCEQAKKWAERSVDYTKEGKYKKAQEASAKCMDYLAKAMEIERVYKLRDPHRTDS